MSRECLNRLVLRIPAAMPAMVSITASSSIIFHTDFNYLRNPQRGYLGFRHGEGLAKVAIYKFSTLSLAH